MKAVVAIRRDLMTIVQAALQRVHGRQCVAAALSGQSLPPAVHVVALGKAAAAMTAGAFDVLGERVVRALAIAPAGYSAPELLHGLPVEFMEGSHPLPDARSLAAGSALVRFLETAPADASFVFLVSGGTSSVVEVPIPGVGLEDLRRLNQWLLGSGFDIRAVNALRRTVSEIKGGGLCRCLARRAAHAFYISDVPGDDPAVIGSGLLAASAPAPLPPGLPQWIEALAAKGPTDPADCTGVSHGIAASLDHARDAAAGAAAALGYPVTVHREFLAGEAESVGARLADALLEATPGVHIWGGETTVTLPPKPGCGGRNQTLALAAASRLNAHDAVGLAVVGTDGRDGNSPFAGALVDGGTVARGGERGLDVEESLRRADAGTFLDAAGDVIRTGPTHTNVMDLVIGLRGV